VNQLFFDKIFEILLVTDHQLNKMNALETLSNLIHSEEHRLKLANDEYFKRVFDTFTPRTDNRTLEKISQMITLICFYPDMID
jgi:hypothetical protein